MSGPVSDAQLTELVTAGLVAPSTLLWNEGSSGWIEAYALPPVASRFAGAGARGAHHGAGTPPALPATAARPTMGPESRKVLEVDLHRAGMGRRRATWQLVGLSAAMLTVGAAVGWVLKDGSAEGAAKGASVLQCVDSRSSRDQVSIPAPPTDHGAAQTVGGAGAPTESGAAAAARSGGGARGGATAPAETGAAPKISGLSGLSGLQGPATGPAAGTTSGSGAGGGLEAADVQRTVASNTGSVRRACWQRALDARDPLGPSTARVVVTAIVGPSGTVQSASADAEPTGFPGLGSCIASRVRSWQFKATGQTSTVKIPFVFAGQ